MPGKIVPASTFPMVGRAELDQMRCAMPDCPDRSAKHPIVFRSRCCDQDLTIATYDPVHHVLGVSCGRCGKAVVGVTIHDAPRPRKGG